MPAEIGSAGEVRARPPQQIDHPIPQLNHDTQRARSHMHTQHRPQLGDHRRPAPGSADASVAATWVAPSMSSTWCTANRARRSPPVPAPAPPSSRRPVTPCGLVAPTRNVRNRRYATPASPPRPYPPRMPPFRCGRCDAGCRGGAPRCRRTSREPPIPLCRNGIQVRTAGGGGGRRQRPQIRFPSPPIWSRQREPFHRTRARPASPHSPCSRESAKYARRQRRHLRCRPAPAGRHEPTQPGSRRGGHRAAGIKVRRGFVDAVQQVQPVDQHMQRNDANSRFCRDLCRDSRRGIGHHHNRHRQP